MSIFTRAQGLGPAALIMGTSIFLSRFIGLIREKVISFYYGAGPDTDIYFASFAIPDFINYLLAGGYFSITLIPLMNRYFAVSNKDGWDFFSTAFSWITIAILTLTAIAWVFAWPLTYITAPGFDDESRVRLTEFLRIILPAQACFLPGACFTAILFMRKQFTVPALTPLIYNGCIIIVGIIGIKLFPDSGMKGFLWGVFIGAALGALILPYIAVKAGGLKLSIKLYHPGLKRFILLALPLMLGQSIVVLDEQFARIFGSFGDVGSISHLNYARRIMMVPVGVVAQAAGVASYPFLAALIAKGDTDGFNQTLNNTLIKSLIVIIPLSFWMISIAEPTISLIFQQGKFDAESTKITAALLVVMLAGTCFWTIQQMLGRAFYAHSNTITPVITGSIATVIMLPLYWLLSINIGSLGVALAGTLSIALYTVFLTWQWVKKHGSDALTGVAEKTLMLIVISIISAIPSWFIARFFKYILPNHHIIASTLAIGFAGCLFALCFMLLSKKIAPEIFSEIVAIIKRRKKTT